VHEVFEAPVLLGISKVKLNVAPSAIIGHEGGIRQGQVTAEQDHMGAGLRAPVRLHAEEDMHRVRDLLVEQLRLGEARLDVPVHGGVFELPLGKVVVSNLAAILATGTSPSLRAWIGEVQGGIAPQLGHEGQSALPRHLHSVVGAKVTIQDEVGPWPPPAIRVRKASSRLGMRTHSGVGVTSALGGVLLPCGRPGRRLSVDSWCCLASTLA
jgi:hypothetical protein